MEQEIQKEQEQLKIQSSDIVENQDVVQGNNSVVNNEQSAQEILSFEIGNVLSQIESGAGDITTPSSSSSQGVFNSDSFRAPFEAIGSLEAVGILDETELEYIIAESQIASFTETGGFGHGDCIWIIER